MFCHSQTLKFCDYLHLIYPPELKIKDTTESSNSTSYLDLLLETDNKGNLSAKIYDKRDDFNFTITHLQQYSGIAGIWSFCVTAYTLL